MDTVVEFLYYWLLRPGVVTAYDDEGNITKTVSTDRTAKEAIAKRGQTWGRLPSGRTLSTDEVNKFLKKYIM